MASASRYRLVRQLGRGGMAEVSEAIAVGEGGFERRVAIKRILPEAMLDESTTRMFVDEARIASHLYHANIVAVVDYGIVDDRAFQVLEFVDGINLVELRRLADEKHLTIPVETVLYVAIGVAHALEHAHGVAQSDGSPLGIVHRDVTPDNILLSWTGDVKLTDFGIALARIRAQHTQAGVTRGKLPYMAPEQLLSGALDRRSDLFSLGCVIHFLLTGVSALSAEDAMTEILAGRPIELGADVPDDIAAVLRTALAPSKELRFAHARDMAEQLGRVLAARADRDARIVHTEFLASLRGPEPPARSHEMPAVELVLQSSRAHLRRFRTLAIDARARERAERAAGGSPRARKLVVATSGIAIAALVGVVIVLLRRDDPAPPDPEAVALAGDARQPSTTVPPRDAALPPSDVLVERIVPSDAAEPEPPTGLPPDKPATPSKERGVVLIGGAGALRATIVIDGKNRGYAPKRLSLPLGSHRLVLIAADGKRLTKTLRVTRAHTDAMPLRWTVP